MSCPKTLTGIEVSCEANAGGIKRVLVAPKEVIELPVATDETGIAVADIKATEAGVTFKEYKFRPQTGSLTKTANIDAIQGTSSWTNVLALQFSRMETGKRVAIQQAVNTGCVAIVEDFNSNAWLLGYDMPVYASAATGVTGTAIGDFAGYTLELTDTSFALPYGVSGNLNTLLTELPVKE